MRLGLGTSTLRSLGRALPERRIEALVDGARRLGVTTIDTSSAYAAGAAERAVARAVRRTDATGRHSEAIGVITKVGFRVLTLPPPLRVLDQPLTKAVQKVQGRQDFSAGRLERAVAASIRRLAGTSLEAVCLHDPPTEVLTARSGVDALIRARGAASWRIGVSLDGPDGLIAVEHDDRVQLLELPAALWAGLEPDLQARLGAGGRTIVLNRVHASGRPFDELVPLLAGSDRAPDVLLLGTRDLDHLQELFDAISGAAA